MSPITQNKSCVCALNSTPVYLLHNFSSHPLFLLHHQWITDVPFPLAYKDTLEFPILKEPSLNPTVPCNCFITSTLSFHSKISQNYLSTDMSLLSHLPFKPLNLMSFSTISLEEFSWRSLTNLYTTEASGHFCGPNLLEVVAAFNEINSSIFPETPSSDPLGQPSPDFPYI